MVACYVCSSCWSSIPSPKKLLRMDFVCRCAWFMMYSLFNSLLSIFYEVNCAINKWAYFIPFHFGQVWLVVFIHTILSTFIATRIPAPAGHVLQDVSCWMCISLQFCFYNTGSFCNFKGSAYCLSSWPVLLMTKQNIY